MLLVRLFTWEPMIFLLVISLSINMRIKGRRIPFATWEASMTPISGICGIKIINPPNTIMKV